MTFLNGDITANPPVKQTYTSRDVFETLGQLGIKKHYTTIYAGLLELAPRSRISTPDDGHIHYSLPQDDFKRIIHHFIQMQESPRRPNIRSFEITDGTTIELRGINDFNWKVCKPLLDELRTTRKQTESGEIKITPVPFKEVRRLFPSNTSQQSIFRLFKILNTAINPSGWSIIRVGEGPRKPVDAPWFLEGPNDNGVQNKGQPKKPVQKNIFDRSISEERRQIAEKTFDRIAFATSLLLNCVANLSHPDAKAIFTKDATQLMLSLLPTNVRLQNVIGEKTPQEYFQESIQMAINDMAGKTYEELPEQQKPIMPFWNILRIESGKPPKTVIFEHFS